MKYFVLLAAVAILTASCSNGSSTQQTTTDSANTTIDTAQHPVTNNPEDMATDGAVDTNGHILKNGKVRQGNDKVLSGDVDKSDTTK